MRITAFACLFLAGCASTPPAGGDAVRVFATGETAPVGTANEDAADDPAIWRNPADPAASLIVATDKKAGLYVYDLTGAVRNFDPAGRLNNVDIVDHGADGGVVVVASDRTDPAHARAQFWRLDPASTTLTPLGHADVGPGEAYGICARRDGKGMRVASILKDGTIVEQRVSFRRGALDPAIATVASRKVPTQAEGCVYDARDGALYVGEEDAGIWRFPAEGAGTLVAQVDGRQLVADVEGLALVPQGADGGLLIASSQGDSAYAVYRLPGITAVGRFRITGGKFGATEETDGIDAIPGDFGPAFPHGLFVAQDGDNGPNAQNFKLVPLDAIEAAFEQ